LSVNRVSALTDRDHLKEKRVKICGAHLEELFSKLLRVFWKRFGRDLRRQLQKDKFDVAKAFRTIRGHLTNGIHCAMATGDWGAGVTAVCRPLEIDKSALAAAKAIRAHTAPLAKNANHIQPRLLHGSHWGFICPAETPGSDNIG